MCRLSAARVMFSARVTTRKFRRTRRSIRLTPCALYRKLRRSAQIIHLEPKKLRIDRAILRHILRIGLPAGVQSAVFALSNIVIQSAINSL